MRDSPEFRLIAEYFATSSQRNDVVLGVGDDAALVRVPAGQDLAVAVDTMVAGRHFPADTSPYDVGYKALAVNLSDLAAMGAEPAWALLALTLPAVDARWLKNFARGLFELAGRYHVALIGGDTTRGPLTISLQVAGYVPRAAALRRTGARPGDLVFVTGILGDAGLGLAVVQGRLALSAPDAEAVLARLNRPQPRVEAGVALRGYASSAIDVSDGLAADLGHILADNGVGATIDVERLPVSPAYRAHPDVTDGWRLALSAGDDYELVFTAPPRLRAEIENRCAGLGLPVTCIGAIETAAGLRCRLPDGALLSLDTPGWDHFDQA